MSKFLSFCSFCNRYGIFTLLLSAIFITISNVVDDIGFPNDYVSAISTEINEPPRVETFSYPNLCVITYGFGALVVLFLAATKTKELVYICQTVTTYWFSISFSMITKTLLKRYVGRPRPDTIAVCGGDGSYAQCSKVLSGYNLYNQFYSFPSGHSTESMAAGLFISLYFSSLFNLPSVFNAILNFLPIFFAFFVASSRIVDRCHHVDDTIMGMLIGGVISYFSEKTLETSNKSDFHPENIEISSAVSASVSPLGLKHNYV